MPFGRREAKIEDLIVRHFDAIESALSKFMTAFEAFLNGSDAFLGMLEDVHAAEDEADQLRRQVIKLLFQGAFVPIFREDYVILTDLVDSIANQAEAVLDDLALARPAIPEQYHEDLTELARATVSAFFPLRKAATALLTNRDNVMQLAEEVSDLEAGVDKIEWRILYRMFRTEMPLADKLVMRDTVRGIGNVADNMEKSADRMSLMVVKRRF